jgi:septum formation protein
MTSTVVLASGSPRRRDLLASLGVTFDVVVPNVDETIAPGELPRPYVERLARAKANAVDQPLSLVVAADTTVVLDGDIIGKPRDRDDARAILTRLGGRTHTVHTGVAVALGSDLRSVVVDTTVTFAPLDSAMIDWYVATGEPDDKAGAYGMQGTGNVLVERIAGSPSNVIGLPLRAVVDLAASLGVDLLTESGSPRNRS